jgi:hypothetical protein
MNVALSSIENRCIVAFGSNGRSITIGDEMPWWMNNYKQKMKVSGYHAGVGWYLRGLFPWKMMVSFCAFDVFFSSVILEFWASDFPTSNQCSAGTHCGGSKLPHLVPASKTQTGTGSEFHCGCQKTVTNLHQGYGFVEFCSEHDPDYVSPL